MTEGEKICSECGEVKLAACFYKRTRSKDGHQPSCKECADEYQKEYQQSEKYKISKKRYKQSERGRAAEKRYRQSERGKNTSARYRQSKEGIEANGRYAQSEKGRKTRVEYSQSERGEKAVKRFWKSEKGKAARRRFNQSPKGKESQRRHGQSPKRKSSQKRYKQSGRGKRYQKVYQAIRRTRKTNAGGSHSIDEWYNLCTFYRMRCLRCDKQFPFKELTVDHVKPVSKGGSSDIWNTQPLCKRCNSSKNDREIDYRQTLPDWIKRDGPVWIQDTLF